MVLLILRNYITDGYYVQIDDLGTNSEHNLTEHFLNILRFEKSTLSQLL